MSNLKRNKSITYDQKENFFRTPRGQFTGKDLEFNQVKYRGIFDKISEKRTILGIFQEKKIPLYS